MGDEQRKCANLIAVALWTELHQKAGQGVLPVTLPKEAADVLRKLALNKLEDDKTLKEAQANLATVLQREAETHRRHDARVEQLETALKEATDLLKKASVIIDPCYPENVCQWQLDVAGFFGRHGAVT